MDKLNPERQLEIATMIEEGRAVELVKCLDDLKSNRAVEYVLRSIMASKLAVDDVIRIIGEGRKNAAKGH